MLAVPIAGGLAIAGEPPDLQADMPSTWDLDRLKAGEWATSRAPAG